MRNAVVQYHNRIQREDEIMQHNEFKRCWEGADGMKTIYAQGIVKADGE